MEFGANFRPNELERVSNLFVGQRSISILLDYLFDEWHLRVRMDLGKGEKTNNNF